jgi:predicted nucleotidyltransferase
MQLSREKTYEILEKIKQAAPVVKIVLFGSRAWGTPRADSDIDVLVVEEHIADKREEIVRLKFGLISSEYSLDIILFSKAEYERKLKEGWSLLEKIEKDGQTYYVA